MVPGTFKGIDEIMVFMVQPSNLPILIVVGLMVWITWLSLRETRRPRG